MSFKSKLISWLGGTPPVPPVSIRSTKIPIDSPEGRAIMAAMKSGYQRAIMEAIRSAGALPEDYEPRPGKEAAAHAAMGGDSDGNFIQWSVWDEERKSILEGLDGWTACRFYHRAGIDDGRGVFGAVKGDFGIWRMRFHCCGFEDELYDDDGAILLSSLTHLPSGLDIGLFETPQLANHAASVAQTLDWSKVQTANLTETDRAAWMEHTNVMRKIWVFNGLCIDDEKHAHTDDGHVIPIYSLLAEEAKPEKLS